MVVKNVLVLFLLVVMLPSYVFSQTTNDAVQPASANKFDEIKIKLLAPNDTINCHSPLLQDSTWQSISFDEIPQNKRFCLRAWINIDNKLLTKAPSLLVGMLGASTFYWDGKLLSQNGEVGHSSSSEKPGVIKTYVRMQARDLTTGQHLLSAEVSTFHVEKTLDQIGYIIAIVDENELSSTILWLSIFSAALIGMLFILAIIFQLIYWLYQKENTYQIFSLFCLSSACILVVEQIKFWFDYSYDWHAIRLSTVYYLTFVASFLLPLFYLYSYRIPFKKLNAILLLIILVGLSFITLSFDQTSILLFSGALLYALVLNIYSAIYNRKGVSNTLILSISLLSLYFMPEYFTEFGFSIVFIFIVLMILVSLIQEMQQDKIKALKAERIKAELLRRNMQPHFLMNCLTQLMELIEVKPQNAIKFISILSDEFRQLTTQNNQQQVLLNDEITLCNKHLTIMSFRYQQSYHLDVHGDTEGILIPPSILHSQIENCFTHNKISSHRPFELLITKHKERVNLTLKTPIENKVDHKGTGLGERYIKAKLAEVDQINQRRDIKNSTFESYEQQQYWVSNFSFVISS